MQVFFDKIILEAHLNVLYQKESRFGTTLIYMQGDLYNLWHRNTPRNTSRMKKLFVSKGDTKRCHQYSFKIGTPTFY